MDRVSVSQEEVNFLSNKQAATADVEADEAERKEITDVLSDKFSVNELPDGITEDAPESGVAAATAESSVTEQTEEDADGAWLDILGSGALKKKVLKAGEGTSKPEHGSRVTIRYHTFLMDDTCVEGPVEATITCGDCDIVQAFDMALMLMLEGELSLVETASRFAYKEQERTIKRPSGEECVIPADSRVRYELQLKEIHVTPAHGDVTVEWIMEECDIKRKRGNELFSAGDYSQAIWSYKKALEWLDNDDPAKKISSPTAAVREVQVSVWNNTAQAYIKLDQWKEALDACGRALKIDPNNVKALFRAAKVYSEQQNFTQSIKLLTKANSVDPSNKTVSGMLSSLRRRYSDQQEKEKAMYRRMVSGGSDGGSSGGSLSSAAAAPKPTDKSSEALAAAAMASEPKKNPLTAATVTLYTGATLIAALAMGAAFYLVR